jgi:hypothetical protein
MPDSATITFQLSREEVARTLWRRIVSRPRYLQSVGLFLALGLVALAAGGDFTIAGTLLVAYAVVRPLVAWQVISRAVGASSLLTDRRTVEFGPPGITASGSDWKISLPWRHFKAWSEDDRNFYLHVTASGVATILPKGAMTDQQQQLLRTCLALIPASGRARG